MIVVTGHTSDLGNIFYNHFDNVKGISRKTGYTFPNDIEKFLNDTQDADILILNSKVCQLELLEETKNKFKKIIVVGSCFHNFLEYGSNSYIEFKRTVFNKVKLLSADATVETKYLHLGISFTPLQNIDDKNNFTEKQIIDLVYYWLDNPVFWDCSMNWKLTDTVDNKLKEFIKRQ